MPGNRYVQFLLLLVVTLLLLCANVLVQDKMNDIIRSDKLVDEQFVEGAPPMVAFTTVALGGFRGLIADYLWFRSISLQEQGKYFELAQLASWIMKLQPKFTGAAAYLGWNLAYNISVTCNSPEDRWRWIHRGIEVLLEAIRYNPNDPELYRELGWIYQHKVGNVLDDAQRYYKYEMARVLLHLFGAHYPDWNALAAAPRTEAELRTRIGADNRLWKIVESWGFPDLKALEKRFSELGRLPDELKGVPPALMNQEEPVFPAKEEDLNLLSNYLRAKWMRDEYLLDPVLVADINRSYGELDWLLPESYAIYWATQGIAHSPNKSETTCERMIVQSLQVSFSNGRMLLPKNEASMYFMIVPNLSLVDTVRNYYLESIKRNPDSPSFKHAMEYFYTDAIVVLYSYGQYSKATEYFKYMRKEFKGNKANHLAMDQFVLKEWNEDLREGSYKQATEYLTSLIMRSCIFLGYGDNAAAEGHLRLAKLAYDSYNRKYSEDRVALPPFQVMKNRITQDCIQNFPFIADRLKAAILAEQPKQPEAEGTTPMVTPPAPDEKKAVDKPNEGKAAVLP